MAKPADMTEAVQNAPAPEVLADTMEKRLYADLDLTKMNLGWTREYSRLSNQVRKEAMMAGVEIQAGMPVEEQQAIQIQQMQAMDDLATLAQDTSAHIAKILLNVPREWLSSDAPDNLDWSDPASQDWLLPEYSQVLATDINVAISDSQKKAVSYLLRSS